MKRTYIYSIIIIISIFIYTGWMLLHGPWIKTDKDPLTKDQYAVQINDTLVDYWGGINFDQGSYKAYFILSSNDAEGLFWKSYIVTDIYKLKRFQKSFRCIAHGGDIATIRSRMILTRDDAIVMDTGLIVDMINNKLMVSGFHNQEFGAMFLKKPFHLQQMVGIREVNIMPLISP